MADQGGYLESVDEIPEPHAFTANVRIGQRAILSPSKSMNTRRASTARDNNMRAAVIHVMADAAVSVLVIVGLLLARAFGWLWMDPLAGIVGACVIASWSYGLIRDTGAILLDMNPDRSMASKLRQAVEMRGRPARRSPSLAVGARASRRDRLGRHGASTRSGLLSKPPRPLHVAVTPDGRGVA